MRIVAALLVISLAAVAGAQPKGRTPDQIKKEIAEAEKKLAELRAELVRVDPPKQFEELKFYDLKVGDIGIGTPARITGTNFRISEIVDSNTMILFKLDNEDKPFVLKGVSTKGLADKKGIALREPLKVTGTAKQGSTTYYVLEPYAAAKPKD